MEFHVTVKIKLPFHQNVIKEQRKNNKNTWPLWFGVRGGTETNRERFADICNSRQSEIGNESWTYCRFDAFIPHT